ncbi:hypothetical protein BGZ83_002589 [Gryganskiella cystojenkinii]|nr:hypothetical protein BGZ83_002589 [Gryganskiella cystojenkinii]
MDLMNQSAPVPIDADWNKENIGGLDLLLKAAQKTTTASTPTTNNTTKQPGQKKTRPPTMALTASFDTPVIVGRGSQATLNLGRINKQVSRRHAIVQWSNEAAAFQITVLGQNGVRINGTGYPSGQQTTLRAGDIVDLVGVKMLFRIPAGTSPAETQQDRAPLGMITPQRAESNHKYHQDADHHPQQQRQQLLTPSKSSPMRDPFSSPVTSGMVTPTARMRHKTLKYDMSSTSRTLFNSPPPSSDAATEFGSSPGRPRSVFDRLADVTPAGYGEDDFGDDRGDAPDSPQSEDNIFWSSSSNASQSLAPAQTRAPLGSLSVNSNNRPQFSPSQSPFASPMASPSPKPKAAATTPSVPKVHKMVLTSSTTHNNNISNTPTTPQPKPKAKAIHRDENSENVAPVKFNDAKKEKKEKKEKSEKSEKPTLSVKSVKELTASTVESKQKSTSTAETLLKAVKDTMESTKTSKDSASKPEKIVKQAVPKATVPAIKKDSTVSKTNSTEKIHKDQTAIAERTITKIETEIVVKSATVLKATVTPISTPVPVQVKETALIVKAPKAVESEEDSFSRESSSPEIPLTKKTTSAAPMDYTEMIIDTLVFARKKKSMTLTELFDEMITSQPNILASQDADEIKEQMLQSLTAARCVGKITRKGKDAYNKPLENQWYYIPECDHNLMRKQTRQEVMPSARKCTLKDKQYFFKMPPKLPYHRKSASPYAVKPTASARRGKESSKLAESGEPSSSSDDPDEPEESPVTDARKRKAAVARQADKKRKGISAATTTTTTTTTTIASAVQSDDDDDDAQHDSLDDLSELSGLSD